MTFIFSPPSSVEARRTPYEGRRSHHTDISKAATDLSPRRCWSMPDRSVVSSVCQRTALRVRGGRSHTTYDYSRRRGTMRLPTNTCTASPFWLMVVVLTLI